MQRRDFISIATASLVVTGLAVSGCTSTTAATASTTPAADTATPKANHRREINANVDATLTRLYATTPGARDLTNKAEGVLVFPSVISAGLGVGGQYGEGALRQHGPTLDYYRIASLSIGLQAGAQSKSIIFLFMTKDALTRFRNSNGWVVGADASVAVLKVGADGNLSMLPTSGPVVAFVLTNAGLMANLTLEGTRIMPIRD